MSSTEFLNTSKYRVFQSIEPQKTESTAVFQSIEPQNTVVQAQSRVLDPEIIQVQAVSRVVIWIPKYCQSGRIENIGYLGVNYLEYSEYREYWTPKYFGARVKYSE